MLLIINDESVNQRIDNFLFNYLKGVPKTRIYKMIRKGEVRVNSGRVLVSYKLNTGDNLRIPPVRVSKTKDWGKNFDNVIHQKESVYKQIKIIQENEGFFIVNKPEGIAVHGGSGQGMGVIEYLRILMNKPSLKLAHRIDKHTSGILIVAQKRNALLKIHKQLRESRVKKTYIACSFGIIKPGVSKIIEKPLFRFYNDAGERMVRVDNQGQYALTKIKSIGVISHSDFGNISLLICEPITGRTHQIRAHLSSVGLPIVGDSKYCSKNRNNNLIAKRMFLHAWKINFLDACSLINGNFEAEIPKSFYENFPEFDFFKFY